MKMDTDCSVASESLVLLIPVNNSCLLSRRDKVEYEKQRENSEEDLSVSSVYTFDKTNNPRCLNKSFMLLRLKSRGAGAHITVI